MGYGIYPVRMLVRGDHTMLHMTLAVVPPATETVVFSIDGSFAASVSVTGKDPKVRLDLLFVRFSVGLFLFLHLPTTSFPDLSCFSFLHRLVFTTAAWKSGWLKHWSPLTNTHPAHQLNLFMIRAEVWPARNLDTTEYSLSSLAHKPLLSILTCAFNWFNNRLSPEPSTSCATGKSSATSSSTSPVDRTCSYNASSRGWRRFESRHSFHFSHRLSPSLATCASLSLSS